MHSSSSTSMRSLLAGLSLVLLAMAPAGALANPCIDVTKVCEDAVAPGEPITFSGTVTNCGWQDLTDVTVTDDHSDPALVLGPVTIAPSESVPFSGSYVPSESPSTNTVTATGDAIIYDGSSVTLTDTASATCESPQEGLCWLTAGGVKFSALAGDMMAEYNGPKDNVGGNVYPGCNSDTGADGGSWTHIDHHDKLHFHGTDIVVDECGNVPGIETGSESPVTPFNYIIFHGTGTLAGIGGNHTEYPDVVCFEALVEDRNEPGNENALLPDGGADVDRYWMMAYDCSDPGDVFIYVHDGDDNPRTLTGGNFQLHISSCEN